MKYCVLIFSLSKIEMGFCRYCISVNIIGFVYSGAQAMDLSFDLATRKYAVQHRKQLRYYFNFAFDQASFKVITWKVLVYE